MKTDRLESLQIGHSHTKDVFNDLQICLVGNQLKMCITFRSVKFTIG